MKAKNLNMDPLLHNCLQGLASDAEYEKAWDWVQQSCENKTYYEKVRDIWISTGLSKEVNAAKKDKSWNKIQDELRKKKEAKTRRKSIIILRKTLRYAAIIIIAFSLGIFSNEFVIKRLYNTDTAQTFTVEAPKGSKSFITLVDGSKVWINAGSKIQYSKDYNLTNRDIQLEGEAYFEVSKNRFIPFQVLSGDLVIKAIGTSFNVKSYPDEDIIEATLVEGIISVEKKTGNGKIERIVLKPNQKVAYYKNKSKLAIEDTKDNAINNSIEPIEPVIKISKNINTEIYTSWRSKKMIFEKESLDNISKKLERLYDVDFIFKDRSLKQYKITGSIEEETLEQVLDAIQLTVPLNYEISNKEVLLSIDKELELKYETLMK